MLNCLWQKTVVVVVAVVVAADAAEPDWWPPSGYTELRTLLWVRADSAGSIGAVETVVGIAL